MDSFLKRANRYKYTLLFFCVLLIYISYFFAQTSVDYFSDTPYDGKQYLNAENYFSSDASDYNVCYPFNTRVGVPYLVALFPSVDVVPMFTIVNSISLICFYSLLIYFLRYYAKASFQNISFVVLWMSLHFMGPLRYYFHDPVSIDLPAMVLEGTVVLAFFKRWNVVVVVSAVLSLFVKESIIPLLVILLIASVLFHKRESLLVLISTLGVVVAVKMYIGEVFPMAVYDMKYKSYLTLYYNIERIFDDPVEILQWSASLLFIGSLFLVTIRPLKGLNKEQKTLLLLALYGVGIGQVAGNDYTRLQFFSVIFIFSALVLFLKNIKPVTFILLVLGSIPFLRVFTILPERYSYKTFPEYFDANTCILWLSYFFIVLVIYTTYSQWNKKVKTQ